MRTDSFAYRRRLPPIRSATSGCTMPSKRWICVTSSRPIAIARIWRGVDARPAHATYVDRMHTHENDVTAFEFRRDDVTDPEFTYLHDCPFTFAIACCNASSSAFSFATVPAPIMLPWGDSTAKGQPLNSM